jgi:hypothetical protein
LYWLLKHRLLISEIHMFGWLHKDSEHLVECRRRVSGALIDYPVYEPLHRQGPNCPKDLSSQEVQEFVARGRDNFSNFEEHRNERLGALRAFLEKFGVDMGLEERGLAAVAAWLPGNCGALVANLRKEETIQIFFRHLVPWEGDLRGLNVIFDLGIFFGECVIFRNSGLHWINWPGISEGGYATSSAYHIGGFRQRRDWLDPIHAMLYLCGDDEKDIRDKTIGLRVDAGRLVGTVHDLSTR